MASCYAQGRCCPLSDLQQHSSSLASCLLFDQTFQVQQIFNKKKKKKINVKSRSVTQTNQSNPINTAELIEFNDVGHC